MPKYLVEYRFIVESNLQPEEISKFDAMEWVMKEISSNLCPEEYVRFREFKDE